MFSALYMAVEAGHQNLAEILLGYGANLTIQTFSGSTPASLYSDSKKLVTASDQIVILEFRFLNCLNKQPQITFFYCSILPTRLHSMFLLIERKVQHVKYRHTKYQLHDEQMYLHRNLAVDTALSVSTANSCTLLKYEIPQQTKCMIALHG